MLFYFIFYVSKNLSTWVKQFLLVKLSSTNVFVETIDNNMFLELKISISEWFLNYHFTLKTWRNDAENNWNKLHFKMYFQKHQNSPDFW